MNEILKNLVVIGVEGDERLKAMRDLLDTQGDAYAFIDAHSPAGMTLAADWAARPLPQAFYNGRLEFYTLPNCRRFLKKHGAQLPEEAPQIPGGIGVGYFDDQEGLRNALLQGINPFQRMDEGGMPIQPIPAPRAPQAPEPLRFMIDDLADHGADEVPFIEEDENDF